MSTKKSLTSYLTKMALVLPEEEGTASQQEDEEDKENQGKIVSPPDGKSILVSRVWLARVKKETQGSTPVSQIVHTH